MIALDTNVLVRFLVADDEKQNRRATELIEAAIQKDNALYRAIQFSPEHRFR